jgi:hypothetical protein
VKPEEMKLAKQVIATFDAELNLKDYKDEYQEGLRRSSRPRSPAGDRRARVRGAAEGRRPDGGAAPQSRRRERDKKKPAKAKLVEAERSLRRSKSKGKSQKSKVAVRKVG